MRPMKAPRTLTGVLGFVCFACVLPVVVLAQSPVPDSELAPRYYLLFDGDATVIASSLSADTLPGNMTIEAWVLVSDWRAAGIQTILSAWGAEDESHFRAIDNNGTTFDTFSYTVPEVQEVNPQPGG